MSLKGVFLFFVSICCFSQQKMVEFNVGSQINNFIINEYSFPKEYYPDGTDLLLKSIEVERSFKCKFLLDADSVKKGDIVFVKSGLNYQTGLIVRISIKKENNNYIDFYLEYQDTIIDRKNNPNKVTHVIRDPEKIAFFLHPILSDIIERYEVNKN